MSEQGFGLINGIRTIRGEPYKEYKT
jgi:hypothetical protein